MPVLVILAHPNSGSFNHAIADTVVRTLKECGHEVILHDLYREEFDPVLPESEIPKNAPVAAAVEEHCRQIMACSGMVIVHPNWWGQPPAVLTGWIDRVLRPGMAYEFDEDDSGEGVPRGLLTGKTAVVFNTSNTAEQREKDFFGDPLDLIWKKCVFEFCGIETYLRRTFSVVVTSSPDLRKQWLDEVSSVVVKYFTPHRK